MSSPTLGKLNWHFRGPVLYECECEGVIVASALKDANGHWRMIRGTLDRIGFNQPEEVMSYVADLARRGGWF